MTDEQREQAYCDWISFYGESLKEDFLKEHQDECNTEDDAFELTESDDFDQYCLEQFEIDVKNGMI